ncbi:class I SAM-dependent methyltransferase [bacterium]|nr:class I SAM-dependent methyltransferase [bacterium]MBU1650589.1 class I SAM-dependent methyltransferase [bacterium]
MFASGIWGGFKKFLQRAGSGALISKIIRTEIGDSSEGYVLEAGCGTGYLGLQMARSGRKTVLLDVSPSALAYAGSEANRLELKPPRVKGSVFHLPFKDAVFSGTFNVGVLDHFGQQGRKNAALEMLRVTKPQGKVTIVTNDVRSYVHPYAMKYAADRGRWPFGFKAAISSLQAEIPDLLKDYDVNEYSRGFLSQFEFGHYFLPPMGALKALFFGTFYFCTWPFAFLNRFAGQYLVTVIKKGDS